MLFIIFLIITAGIFVPLLLYTQAENASPSFSRQEINDEIHDVKQIVGIENNSQKRDNYNKNPLYESVDIQRISYSSDGNFLNGTLWVGGSGVKENPSLYGANVLAYGMLIDADNNEKTGKAGFDYQVEIQWSNGTWHKTSLEWSSDNNYRILNVTQNNNGFFKNNQNYVLLSLDLNIIVSPHNYKLMFYSTAMYGKSIFIYDLSSFIDIPPPQYTILTLPNPLVLRQGEQKIIGVQLKSTTGSIPELINFIIEEHQSNIDVDFNPDKLNISSFGVEPAPFKITLLKNAQIGQYTIPLLANISTGSFFPLNVFFGDINATISTKGSKAVPTNLTISVIEPVSIQEQVKDFWSIYGPLISLIGAGFAGSVSTYVFDHLRKRKESKNLR
ncbi:MAG TPA: hypothetical protein VE076_00905 [Nitrososphaeraceae archaeon]|nr:hypothetical protein [Nitrososphaeraceae archaeon]